MSQDVSGRRSNEGTDTQVSISGIPSGYYMRG
jgi:hypothetical protein